jgi:predicted TPR repeat methyltransferase
MMGDLDGARAALDQALALEPTSTGFHLLRGSIEIAAGHVDAARQAFTKALQLDPDNREAAARLRQLEGRERRPVLPAPDVR